MKNEHGNGLDLCEPRYREDLGWLKCGRIVAQRDPTGPEACPSYGGGGLFICAECVDIVGDFMRRAHDARAMRLLSLPPLPLGRT